jgi:hypothetical protein
MTYFEYEAIDDIVNEQNISLNKLLRICYQESIKIYIYVLATDFIVEKINTFGLYEKSNAFIDRKYLRIDFNSIDDYAHLDRSDVRKPCFQYLLSSDYPSCYLNPNDTSFPIEISKHTLYIHNSDLEKLKPSASAKQDINLAVSEIAKEKFSNKTLDTLNETYEQNTSLLVEPIQSSKIEKVDSRQNLEVQQLAIQLANEYMEKNNGAIPSKKQIAHEIFKIHRNKYGVDIARTFRKTWKRSQ